MTFAEYLTESRKRGFGLLLVTITSADPPSEIATIRIYDRPELRNISINPELLATEWAVRGEEIVFLRQNDCSPDSGSRPPS